MLAVLAAASAVIFALMQLAAGDAAHAMLGLNAAPETVAALRHKLGLDLSLTERYLRWMGGLISGDFGTSLTYGVPVGQLLTERLSLSLPLALMALALSTVIAFAIGLISVLHLGRWIDGVLNGLLQLGLAIPDFWLGMLLVALFAERLHWVSAGGFPGWQAGTAGALRALLLPAVALAVPQAAILCRILRNELASASRQDYVRTARAKGLSRRGALLRHALPNGLVPVLTVLGMQASFLLAGTIIVENVFTLPGLGRLVFQAVTQRDLPTVQAVVMVMVAAVVCVAALVDLACAAIDPRWQERR
ncbi:MAG: ABC transporter permease [Telmatospirillum sp.]|nr:ABC transporter permease [Telmatospirillum sp.]